MISDHEREFVAGGVAANIRSDGRERFDFRCMSLQVGVITGCNGSARLQMSNSDILVGVKVDLGEPNPDFPDAGIVQFSVECCPGAAPEFEGRGTEELNLELERCLESVLAHSGAINLKSLCVLPGQQCWIVYVDVLVLDSAGNLFDTISIATRAALHNTKLPKFTLSGTDEDGEGEIEIEISDDVEDGVALDVSNMPICVSLTKIGAWFVADTTIEEELCAEARLTFGVNDKGFVFTLNKGGSGGIDPAVLSEMIQVAKKIGVGLCQSLNDTLNKLEANGGASEGLLFA